MIIYDRNYNEHEVTVRWNNESKDYVVRVDGEFYSTHESMASAREEVYDIIRYMENRIAEPV